MRNINLVLGVLMTGQLTNSVILEIHSGFRLQWEEGINAYILLSPGGLETLNRLSSEILLLCDGIHTLNEIVDVISQKFYDAYIRTQIINIVKTACSNGWIVVH